MSGHFHFQNRKSYLILNTFGNFHSYVYSTNKNLMFFQSFWDSLYNGRTDGTVTSQIVIWWPSESL